MRGCVNRPDGLIYSTSFLVFKIDSNFHIRLNMKVRYSKTNVLIR